MSELVRNARLGWLHYIDNGKVAALLLAVLLFLWLGRHLRQKRLLLYTTVMTMLCICPLTAALLMVYQTKFYDYEWIWSLVPATLVIAMGGTIFLAEIWKSYGRRESWKPAVLTVFCLGVLLLCGSLGRHAWQEGQTFTNLETEERRQIAAALDAILAEEGILGQGSTEKSQTICLWAPQEVMEYARAYSGRFCLPYGRNMWDDALNAYSYEAYDDTAREMYEWMCIMEEGVQDQGGILEESILEESIPEEGIPEENISEEGIPAKSGGTAEEKKLLQKALAAGVNRLLLPDDVGGETLSFVEKALGTQARELEGYYLFYVE